jgi:hypothetical protein
VEGSFFVRKNTKKSRSDPDADEPRPLRKEGGKKIRKSGGADRHESEDHIGLHRVQTAQLQQYEKQEEHPGSH